MEKESSGVEMAKEREVCSSAAVVELEFGGEVWMDGRSGVRRS